MHQPGVSLKGYLAYLCNVGLQNFMGSQSKNATIFLLQPLIFQGWQQMFWSVFEKKMTNLKIFSHRLLRELLIDVWAQTEDQICGKG